MAAAGFDLEAVAQVRKNRSIFPRPAGSPRREWMNRIPSLAQARASWRDANGLPLST
jgi:hypothetical protein